MDENGRIVIDYSEDEGGSKCLISFHREGKEDIVEHVAYVGSLAEKLFKSVSEEGYFRKLVVKEDGNERNM